MNNTIIPKHTKSIDFINKIMDKGALKDLLTQIYLEFGGAKSANLANALKNLGYKYATKSGVTISIKDLDVPPQKKALWQRRKKKSKNLPTDI